MDQVLFERRVMCMEYNKPRTMQCMYDDELPAPTREYDVRFMFCVYRTSLKASEPVWRIFCYQDGLVKVARFLEYLVCRVAWTEYAWPEVFDMFMARFAPALGTLCLIPQEEELPPRISPPPIGSEDVAMRMQWEEWEGGRRRDDEEDEGELELETAAEARARSRRGIPKVPTALLVVCFVIIVMLLVCACIDFLIHESEPLPPCTWAWYGPCEG